MNLLHAQLRIYQERINHYLEEKLADLSARYCPEKLAQALAYATLDQGKRLRPALVYAIGEALELPVEQLHAPAAAIELIHCYSLVHDDLPAMDDDHLRRGKPTTHIQFDEATAILVGDAQQSLAFQILAEDPQISDSAKIEMVKILAHAAGPSGMVGGQQIDMDCAGNLPDQQALQQMHLMKTGALIEAALLLGACQTPQYPQIKALLSQYAQAIGLAFQVQDDILDIESTTETLGKPQGSDLNADKSTYPKLLGLAQSKQLRDQLIAQALERLQQLPSQSSFLEALTHYIGQRDK
ncbi:MAG: polyprenyl synthetase family protein [Thiotrichales bacterium]|nr:polyprenyl synthetase family protein [Thiotrichales bacterium]